MHARVVTLHAGDGNLDLVLRLTREVVIPAAEKQEGFVAFVVMSDPTSNEILSITLWDTEADMLASERGEFFQEQISRVVTLLAGPPEVRHYELDALS